MNTNNLHKHKFFGILSDFKECKGVPRQKTWRNADLALGSLTIC